MARRPPDEQDLHDRVISAIWQQLQDAGRLAETNPGPLRMVSVCGHYPDVMAALVHERMDIVRPSTRSRPGAASKNATPSTSGSRSPALRCRSSWSSPKTASTKPDALLGSWRSKRRRSGSSSARTGASRSNPRSCHRCRRQLNASSSDRAPASKPRATL